MRKTHIFLCSIISLIFCMPAFAAELGGQLKLKQEQPMSAPQVEQPKPEEPKDQGPSLEETMSWLKGKLDGLNYVEKFYNGVWNEFNYQFDVKGCDVIYSYTKQTSLDGFFGRSNHEKYKYIFEFNMANIDYNMEIISFSKSKSSDFSTDSDIWFVGYHFHDNSVVDITYYGDEPRKKRTSFVTFIVVNPETAKSVAKALDHGATLCRKVSRPKSKELF